VPDHRLAVIDLGSNSFRLVVFASNGWWKRTDEIYEPVRIGQGLAETGELGRKPMERAMATLEVFAHFCRASGIEAPEIDAVATSAIRDAVNASEFLERARRETGLEIRVLSGAEEGRYGYLAAVNSTTLSDGAVLDLGGGSMQLARVVGRHLTDQDSWPLGAVRMTEKFGLAEDGPAPKKAVRALRDHALRKLERAQWLPGTGGRLVGLGGTVRNLAAASQRAGGLPEFGVQGHVIGAGELDELIERLAELAPAERGKVPGIKPARGDLILAGAVVVRAAMEAGGFEAVETTEAGLREGIFFERHLAGDPPIVDDVRRASVLNLAGQYEVDPAHTEHVARLALGLFDELAAAELHPGDAIERELLWASCVLHDTGVTVDYDDHHKHSRYLVLNAGLPGFSQREVALIGQVVRYHRKGMPSLGPFEALAKKGDAERVDRCATLLRLAEDLERSRDQAVKRADIAVENGAVRMELVADEDIRVARWAAARESDLFKRAYGRDLVITD
jgi:exopolyphosphatase/guanosine-5'-triphosphate,3'-diphosphate pyrophosphatase